MYVVWPKEDIGAVIFAGCVLKRKSAGHHATSRFPYTRGTYALFGAAQHGHLNAAPAVLRHGTRHHSTEWTHRNLWCSIFRLFLQERRIFKYIIMTLSACAYDKCYIIYETNGIIWARRQLYHFARLEKFILKQFYKTFNTAMFAPPPTAEPRIGVNDRGARRL